MSAFLLGLVMLAALAVAAFSAGAETGFLSVSRGRILYLVREGSRAAQRIHEALSHMSDTLTTLLIGNNLANVVYSSASASLAVICFPESGAARTCWSMLAALLLLFLAEFLPKTFASARPLRRMLAVAGIYRIFARVLYLPSRLLVVLTNLFVPRREVKHRLSADDLLRALEDRANGVCLSEVESALIAHILVSRARGRFVTTDSLLHVLEEEDS